eukprot:5867817-Prymnesium_polylepis.1
MRSSIACVLLVSGSAAALATKQVSTGPMPSWTTKAQGNNPPRAPVKGKHSFRVQLKTAQLVVAAARQSATLTGRPPERVLLAAAQELLEMAAVVFDERMNGPRKQMSALGKPLLIRSTSAPRSDAD